MEVPLRPMWSTGQSCPAISNSCQMGKDIQKWKSVNSQHASQWCSVSIHTDMSVANWPVNGWRWALDYDGISWMYRDSRVCSAANFTIGLKNCCQVGATLFKWDATLDTLRYMSCQSGMISLQREQHIKWDNCNRWNMGKGLQTGTQMTVLWMVSLPQKCKVSENLYATIKQ